MAISLGTLTLSDITLGTSGTTNASITVSGTAINRYLSFYFRTPGGNNISSFTVATTGSTYTLNSSSLNVSSILTALNGASSLGVYVAVYEDDAVSNPISSASSNTVVVSLASRCDDISINAYNLDVGGNVVCSWSEPSTHSGWRTKVEISVDNNAGVFSGAFTRQDFTGTSMSYTPTSAQLAAMVTAMGGVSPQSIRVRVLTGWYLSGGSTYFGSYSAGSVNTVTKSFATASTISFSNFLVGAAIPFTISLGNSITTHNLNLIMNGVTVLSRTGISGSGTITPSAAEITAMRAQVTLAAGEVTTLQCLSYAGATYVGTTTDTATASPEKSLVLTFDNFTIGNAFTFAATVYASGLTHTIEFFLPGAVNFATRYWSAGTTSATITFSDAENALLLNAIAANGTTVAVYAILTSDGVGTHTSTTRTATTSASTISVYNNFNIESTVPITISSAVPNNLVHTLIFKIGATTVKTITGVGTSTSVVFSTTEKNIIYRSIALNGTTVSVIAEIHTYAPDGTEIGVMSSITKTATAEISTLVTPLSALTIGSNLTINITNKSLTSYTHTIELKVGAVSIITATLATGVSSNVFTLNSTQLGLILDAITAGQVSTTVTAYLITKDDEGTQLGTTTSSTLTASTAASIITTLDGLLFNIENTNTAAFNLTKYYSGLTHLINYKIGATVIATKYDSASAITYTFLTVEKQAIYALFTANELSKGFTIEVLTQYYNGSTYKQIGALDSITATGQVTDSSISSYTDFSIGSNVTFNFLSGSSLFSNTVDFLIGTTSILETIKTETGLTTYNKTYTLSSTEINNILDEFINGDTFKDVKAVVKTYYGLVQIGTTKELTKKATTAASTILTYPNFNIETAIAMTLNKSYNIYNHSIVVKADTTTIKTITGTASSFTEVLSDGEKDAIYASMVAAASTKTISIEVTTLYGAVRIGAVVSSSATASVAIPTIAAFSPFTIGSTFGYNLTKGSSRLSYKVEFYNGATLVATRTYPKTTANTYSKTGDLLTEPELDILYPTMRYVRFTSLEARCTSLYNTTQIGPVAVTSAVATIDINTIKPSFTMSNSEVTTNPPVNTLVGGYLQLMSKLLITMGSPTAGRGSAIKSKSISFEGLSTTTAYSLITNYIVGSGNLTITYNLTDDRDVLVSTTQTVYVYPYYLPYGDNFNIVRCDEDGTINVLGDYAYLTFNAYARSIVNVTQKNALKHKLYYKKTTDLTYTPVDPQDDYIPISSTLVGTDLVGSGDFVINNYETIPVKIIFDSGFSYDFKGILYDNISSAQGPTIDFFAYDVLPSAKMPLSISEHGISSGKIHSGDPTHSIEAGADIITDTKFSSDLDLVSDINAHMLDGRHSHDELLKEPTGFTNNENITVTYDSITRKVTLTGTFEAYYNGLLVSELTNGWVSDAHPDVVGAYFLYYSGGTFVWSIDPWDFNDLMISYVQYNTHDIGMREVHGFMPYTVHRELHDTIGTYKEPGTGILQNYTPNSTTATNRRPTITTTNVRDEDLQTIIAAKTAGSYTQRYLTGAAVRSFTTGAAEIIPVSGSQPYWNENVAGTWQQTLFSNNDYGAIFVVALPVTADVTSQLYRYMFVQPQEISASLTTIQGLTPNNLTHGVSTSLLSEYVFIAKIIIRYQGGNWTIIQVDELSGNKLSQISVPGGFLSTVTTDTTLTGDGTVGNPLSAASRAPIDSPTFTGDPKAPTPLTTDNDTSIATTAFVQAIILAAKQALMPVGHVYTTTTNHANSAAVAAVVGFGTWVKVAEGANIVSAGVTFTPLSTGGAATHVHTSAAHTHTVAAHSHTSAAHTHTVASHSHTSDPHTHTVASHVHSSPVHTHSGTGLFAHINISTASQLYIAKGTYAWTGNPSTRMTGSGYTTVAGDANTTGAIVGGSTANNAAANTGGAALTTDSTTPANVGGTTLTTDSTTPGATGTTALTSDSTTPGNTGSASNYAPYLALYMWYRSA